MKSTIPEVPWTKIDSRLMWNKVVAVMCQSFLYEKLE